MTDNCLAKLALYEIENSSDNRSDWKCSIKHLLKLMSLENVHANPQTYGIDQLNTLCKNKIRSIFTEFWNSELSMADIRSVRNSKLRTYKQFKNKFALENCLNVTPNFENRKLIAKFRCSDHELMIEKGRQKKIDVEERLCYMCSEKKLEDELHFLLECHAYDRIRIGFTNFYKVALRKLITDNFIRILSCEGKDTISALVRFLKLAYKIRNRQSYEKHLINASFCFQSSLRWSNNFYILLV